MIPRPTIQRRSRAFTLMELLIAVTAFAIVLAAINSIFYGALRLRNKTTQSFDDALPLQHTLELLRKDIANLLPPGGTLSGQLQTSPGTGIGSGLNSGNNPGASVSSMALLAAATRPGQSSPEFHTTGGTIDETSPWAETQKVSYYLVPSTNGSAGRDLVRSVTRNLLPSFQDQPAQIPVLSGVESIYFQFHDGVQWKDIWDSATETTTRLPVAIKVQINLAVEERGRLQLPPVEMVVPILAHGGTNSTSSTTETSGGGL